MAEAKGILFLTLRLFSATGGIEKVSRQIGKALYELSFGHQEGNFEVLSMYDRQDDINEKYFPATAFKGYSKQKILFVCDAVRKGVQKDIVIITHINLLLAGYLVKLLAPKTKLVLLAHGIEVWEPFTGWKKKMLHTCDLVLPVSQFTKSKMMALHGMPAEKFFVLNNCLDPFLTPVAKYPELIALKNRYHLQQEDLVIMTLTRLSSGERYKGYEKVIFSVQELKKNHPNIKYLIVGQYDREEKQWLDAIIDKLELHNDIIFAGFVPDEEIAAHFGLAHLYIMPSKYEGFGIAFIEALYYGKPVIAGNIDGSPDALAQGKFGMLVNPDNQDEITGAIATVLDNREHYVPKRQEVEELFSFPVYKEKLQQVLNKL